MKISSKSFLIGLTTLFFARLSYAQQSEKISIQFNDKKTYQTIENFAASDAWACQFVGNWPDAKKNAIADWLFSMDTLSNGSPKGIGLSMWRYNFGAGSAEQDDSSGIKDDWRRAASTTGENGIGNKRVEAQNWFLKAAQQRGVQQFLAFFNSPPVHLTKNGKAYANKGLSNIDSTQYKAFADYTLKAMKQIKNSTGITFNFISPVNEPQWDWSDGGQEGCPYNNTEISNLVKAFSKTFRQNKVEAKLLVSESGEHKYLFPAKDRFDKDHQLREFFISTSANYIGDLPNVSATIASHSYFTTSPFTEAMALRKKVKDSVTQIKNLVYWQSEYCILGDNAGEINGNKKDLGMNAALYVAKVIYQDLVAADASAWQWWTAVSAYNYKDGLVYVEKNKIDGNFSDSKILWAMGNYSRFIRPGMKRIDVINPPAALLVSAYKDIQKNKLVFVFVNETITEQAVALDNKTIRPNTNLVVYTTDETRSLDKSFVVAKYLVIPSKSVVTVVIN